MPFSLIMATLLSHDTLVYDIISAAIPLIFHLFTITSSFRHFIYCHHFIYNHIIIYDECRHFHSHYAINMR